MAFKPFTPQPYELAANLNAGASSGTVPGVPGYAGPVAQSPEDDLSRLLAEYGLTEEQAARLEAKRQRLGGPPQKTQYTGGEFVDWGGAIGDAAQAYIYGKRQKALDAKDADQTKHADTLRDAVIKGSGAIANMEPSRLNQMLATVKDPALRSMLEGQIAQKREEAAAKRQADATASANAFTLERDKNTQTFNANEHKLDREDNALTRKQQLALAATAQANAAAEKADAKRQAQVDANSSFATADAGLTRISTDLGGVLGKSGAGSIEDTTGTGWDMLKRNLPGTDEYNAKNNIQRTLSKTVVEGLKGLKAAGLGSSLFNSEKESERLEQSIAAINWNDETEARRQLTEIQSDLLDTQKRFRDAYRQKYGTNPPAAPSGGGASLNDFDNAPRAPRGASGSF